MQIARAMNRAGARLGRVYTGNRQSDAPQVATAESAGTCDRSGPPISLRASATAASVPSALHRRYRLWQV